MRTRARRTAHPILIPQDGPPPGGHPCLTGETRPDRPLWSRIGHGSPARAPARASAVADHGPAGRAPRGGGDDHVCGRAREAVHHFGFVPQAQLLGVRANRTVAIAAQSPRTVPSPPRSCPARSSSAGLDSPGRARGSGEAPRHTSGPGGWPPWAAGADARKLMPAAAAPVGLLEDDRQGIPAAAGGSSTASSPPRSRFHPERLSGPPQAHPAGPRFHRRWLWCTPSRSKQPRFHAHAERMRWKPERRLSGPRRSRPSPAI